MILLIEFSLDENGEIPDVVSSDEQVLYDIVDDYLEKNLFLFYFESFLLLKTEYNVMEFMDINSGLHYHYAFLHQEEIDDLEITFTIKGTAYVQQ